MAGGRTRKLNKTLIKNIEKHLKQGNFETITCELVGISTGVYYRWLNVGTEILDGVEEKDLSYTYKNPEMYELCVELVQTVKTAKAKAEAQAVANILKAGKNPKSWQANAWYLERKYPHRWGKDTNNGNEDEEKALDTFLDTVDQAAEDALQDETK